MRLRTLISGSLILALIGVVACRNSTKTTPPAATSSPVPVQIAPQQKPAPATPTPAQAEASPGPPIPVTPPASFSANNLPPGRLEFAVSGKAGQVLLMKVKEVANADYDYGTDRRYKISAQLAANGSSVLEAMQEGGTCTDNTLYALPKSGTYKVMFEPLPGEEHDIDFETIASDDPRVNVGIKPEQISIDLGSFARKDQIKFVPLSMADGCLNDAWPSHQALWNNSFEFRIMPVAGYQKVLPSDRGMELLKRGLLGRKADTKVIELPYSTNGEAALEVSTRPQFLEGDGWRGLRWIGHYGQDPSCGFQEYSYVFQGLTNDNRFFLIMRANVTQPAVGQRLAQDCGAALEKTPNKNIDEMFKKDMPAIFDRDISAADPTSFRPSLNQLDAVIKSLKLKP